VDDYGQTLTSTNPTDQESWRTKSIKGQNSLNSISCPSTKLCIAVGSDGNVLSSTHPLTGGWKGVSVDRRWSLVSISCPSTKLCVAVDGVRNVFTSTNPTGGAQAWQRTSDGDAGVTAVSCPTLSRCVAVDSYGNEIVGTRRAGL
jgi:hypothetical protein